MSNRSSASSRRRRLCFEATGFLTTEKWEEPEIEESLNRKRFDKVHQLIFYLASQNQRKRVKDLLERLYMRGIGIVDLYDDVLSPVIENSEQALANGELTPNELPRQKYSPSAGRWELDSTVPIAGGSKRIVDYYLLV